MANKKNGSNASNKVVLDATENTEKVEEKTYTEAELNKLIAEATQKAVESALNQFKAAQTTTNNANKSSIDKDYVTVMYIGLMANGTVVSLDKWGVITYSGGTLDIPKREFLQGLGTPVINKLLRDRSLIVTEGLTDEERKRFNLDYKEGDVFSQAQFLGLLNYKSDDVIAIFSKLCVEHKRIFAAVYNDAYFYQNDNRINQLTVQQLNQISKAYDKEGMFKAILDDMGSKLSA